MQFDGQPILIEFRPQLRALRGKLVSGGDYGSPVHAGSFLRERRIVLDRALLRSPAERDRILAHELFHFVWWRSGRKMRAAYEALIAAEFDSGKTGEMAWSAEWRRNDLISGDREGRTRRWREYLCESFCDTAAAYALGIESHPEITLGPGARRRRHQWMAANLDLDRLRI
jgi:hypothetical protein